MVRTVEERRGRTARADASAAFAGAARRSINTIVRAGVEAYRRDRHLPGLIPVASDQLADPDVETHRRIVARLARALRAERNRGRAGHWTYDLNRHIALCQAYAAERQLVARHKSGASRREV